MTTNIEQDVEKKKSYSLLVEVQINITIVKISLDISQKN